MQSQDRRDSRSLTSSEEMFVVGLAFENPCLYLRELCQQVQDISGLSVSVSTICRLLRRHGLTRKKESIFLNTRLLQSTRLRTDSRTRFTGAMSVATT